MGNEEISNSLKDIKQEQLFFYGKIAKREPHLFAHWQIGMVGSVCLMEAV